jgi:hypothetical protein
MSALRDDKLDLRRVEAPPEKITRLRRETEQMIGRKLPPGHAEIARYIAAGLEPPTE